MDGSASRAREASPSTSNAADLTYASLVAQGKSLAKLGCAKGTPIADLVDAGERAALGVMRRKTVRIGAVWVPFRARARWRARDASWTSRHTGVSPAGGAPVSANEQALQRNARATRRSASEALGGAARRRSCRPKIRGHLRGTGTGRRRSPHGPPAREHRPRDREARPRNRAPLHTWAARCLDEEGMHAVAAALEAAGITPCAVDGRCHGGSGGPGSRTIRSSMATSVRELLSALVLLAMSGVAIEDASGARYEGAVSDRMAVTRADLRASVERVNMQPTPSFPRTAKPGSPKEGP